MAELVYQSGLVDLWCGDAAEVLPELKTESVGLVLTDPPYGIEYVSGMRADKMAAIAGDGGGVEARDVVAGILEECVRLVAQHRHLYVFGPEMLEARGMKVSAPAQLIWNKQTVAMGDLYAPWGPAHELIHFYTSKHRHAGKKGQETLPVRMRKGSVLSYSKKMTGRKLRHPTEKPLELLAELVESSSRIGEVILDPFAGVGSTGVAAVLAGRRAVLVEVDPGYCEIAAERLAKAEKLRVESSTI